MPIKINFSTLCVLVFWPVCFVFSQNTGSIKGKILNEGKGVSFANVGLMGTNYGVACDEQGLFHLKGIAEGAYTLQVSAVGYKKGKQTVTIVAADELSLNLELGKTTESLNEVVITGTLKEVTLMESAVPIQVFKPAYFRKNPTPALFESLQIVNGVRPQVNCNVCNTGDIHINGMEGPYTMITIDGMPIVGGLSSVYGLNGIPNSMIERMEVIKGPASTLFGSEAVGGLINVITKSPKKTAAYTFDVFGTTWGEVNTDASVKFKLGNNHSVLGVNYFNYTNPIDNNGDNFTDVTLQDRVSVFNKWNFNRESNKEASVAARYVYEDRWGGEMQWTPEFRGGDSIYGESIYTIRYELIGKYQLPTKEDIFLSFSLSSHDQNSVYGDVPYLADQNIAYAQLHWNKVKWDVHELLFGAAYRYTFYDDNTPATGIDANNQPSIIHLPGVFIQDNISLNEKNKLLLGMRYDHDSRHGHILTPRANYKWSPNKDNTLRFSLGTGYRVVNLFTEDHAAVTGARDVIINEALDPEQSYNGNIHYQRFINTTSGFINFDASLFYTYFTNKIVPDYETNAQQIIYENSNGHAVSRGASFNATLNFTSPLQITFGGTFLDVFQMEENDLGELVKERQLLTENVSGTFSLGYKFYKSNIKIDYSGNVYGPMRLPLVENDFRPEFSDWYSIQNIQVTKTLSKGWEVYGGIKNILNYTPPAYSILRPNDPFDKEVDSPDNPNGYTFDPTYVFAPNQGIRGFLGIRYNFYRE